MTRFVAGCVLLALLAPNLRADQDTGLKLLHQARAAAERGDAERALELIQDARIEWPGSPLVAHELADHLLDDGAWVEALAEYRKGSAQPFGFRAAFNAGVARHRAAEAELAEAGIPADPQGLGDVPDPSPLIAALDAAAPQLQAARHEFLDALADHPDERARDSVAALTQRLDELAEMREHLEQQKQEQEDQQDQDEDSEDQQQEDQEDDGEQENSEDQEPSEDSEDSEESGDEEEGDQPEDEQQEEQADDQPPEPSEEEQAPPPAKPSEAVEQRRLTPQQLQELLDTLDALEEQAQRLQAQRRAANRRSVEKDW